MASGDCPENVHFAFEWFHADLLDWYWPLLEMRAAGQDVPDGIPLAGLLILGRGLGKVRCWKQSPWLKGREWAQLWRLHFQH